MKLFLSFTRDNKLNLFVTVLVNLLASSSSLNLCEHGCSGHGRCDTIGSCLCDPAWAGRECTMYLSSAYVQQEADLFSCMNNCSGHGDCVQGTCMCDQGHEGPACNSATTCNGGCGSGHCIAGICVCTRGFFGPRCEDSLCPNNCWGHGFCQAGSCTCQPGWSGRQCQLELETAPLLTTATGNRIALATTSWTHREQGNGKPNLFAANDASAAPAWQIVSPGMEVHMSPSPSINSQMNSFQKGYEYPASSLISSKPGVHSPQGTSLPVRLPPVQGFKLPFIWNGMAVDPSKLTAPPSTGVVQEPVQYELPITQQHVLQERALSARWHAQNWIQQPVQPLQRKVLLRGVSGKVQNAINAGRVAFLSAARATSAAAAERVGSQQTPSQAGPWAPVSPAEDASLRTQRALRRAHHHASRLPGSYFARDTDMQLHETEATVDAHASRGKVKTCYGGCGSHGICNSSAGTCLCAAGWQGLKCDMQACPDDCNRNGVCMLGKCICDAKFYGVSCQKERCPGDCSGHGYCFGGSCQCEDSFQGRACDMAVIEEKHVEQTSKPPAFSLEQSTKTCAANCSGHGSCSLGVCMCSDGWSGSDCSSQVCCSGHGTCDARRNQRCDCHSGWGGPLCQVQLSCADSTCSGHGMCLDSGRCQCSAGYSGISCDFSAVGLSCPDGCNGHGHCMEGACVCDRDWAGESCSNMIPQSAYISAEELASKPKSISVPLNGEGAQSKGALLQTDRNTPQNIQSMSPQEQHDIENSLDAISGHRISATDAWSQDLSNTIQRASDVDVGPITASWVPRMQRHFRPTLQQRGRSEAPAMMASDNNVVSLLSLLDSASKEQFPPTKATHTSLLSMLESAGKAGHNGEGALDNEVPSSLY